MTTRNLRLILNGKKAGLPGIREAVEQVRKDGHDVDVRVTWEGGHAARFAAEAIDDGVEFIVAGGGDGTVNEIVNGIFSVTDTPRTAMAVLPLGTANDFATGNGIPIGDPVAALKFAAEADPVDIDVARVNDRYFINAVIAGFGAEVTFNTSERLKSVIGGGAYAMTGFLMALKHTPYQGKVTWEDGHDEQAMIFASVSNGRNAGGFTLAPNAKLNDGLLDVMSIPDFSVAEIPSIVSEIRNLGRSDTSLVRCQQVEWFEVEAQQEIPLTPDGEHMVAKSLRFDILKRRLPVVLPADLPSL